MLMPIRILRTCVTGLPHPVTLFCVHQCFNSPVPGRWLHATKQPQNQRPHHEATHQPRRALDHHLPPSHRRSPVLSFFAFDHRAFVSRARSPRHHPRSNHRSTAPTAETGGLRFVQHCPTQTTLSVSDWAAEEDNVHFQKSKT